MRITLLIPLLCVTLTSNAQSDSLSTAKRSAYMTKEEKAMIAEINLVRSDPQGYVKYIMPLLAEAEKTLSSYGKGGKNYSLTTTTTTQNGRNIKTVDTTWHFINDENVKALKSLINDLRGSKKLSVLQPDSGIYLAAKKHAADQHSHEWTLSHTGSDGSNPWDRIQNFSPSMSEGNENIAMIGGTPSVREIVILLLVDAGIPGYGHRYNMLDPNWTHCACTADNFKGMYYWWLQEFGTMRSKEKRR